jgi:hypothetical protein
MVDKLAKSSFMCQKETIKREELFIYIYIERERERERENSFPDH